MRGGRLNPPILQPLQMYSQIRISKNKSEAYLFPSHQSPFSQSVPSVAVAATRAVAVAVRVVVAVVAIVAVIVALVAVAVAV